MAAQAQLQRPKSASVLRFYGIDHYGGRKAACSNLKAVRGSSEGRLQTRWSNPGRVTASEAFAGRVWGPVVVDVYRETRKPDEW